MVIPPGRRLFLMHTAHNDVGHHGFFATNALLAQRYWWPHMADDITWFIRTCHICQTRQTRQNLIPPELSGVVRHDSEGSVYHGEGSSEGVNIGARKGDMEVR